MGLWRMLSSLTVLTLLTLCALVKEGVAITCYMCNSAPSRNDQLCETLKGDVSPFVQDCDQLSHPSNLSYTLCRKMHQTITNNEGDEEVRIIRQCGTEGSLGCSRRTRPNTLQVLTCHCDTPLCNPAPRPLPPAATPSRLMVASTAAVWIGTLFLLRRFRAAMFV